MNPITDGQLEGERPGWVERVLAAGVTVCVLLAARALGVLSWPRINWLLPVIVITSAVFVWFPEFVAGLASARMTGYADAPATGIRMVGWGVLLAVAVILGVIWVSK